MINEDLVEQAALGILQELGWRYEDPVSIAPDGPRSRRVSHGDVVLPGLLEEAAKRLNPGIPEEVLHAQAGAEFRDPLSDRGEPAHSPPAGRWD
ncbi:hypothetical protein N9491_08625 [Planktomarina temperata]|nr:hypothetical protein [Planktomarina temperata]